jgi:glutaredoxin
MVDIAKNRIFIIVLGAIILLNIIAILLIHNKIAERQVAVVDTVPNDVLSESADVPSEDSIALPPREVVRTQPLVKTYIMNADCSNCNDLYDIMTYVVALNETINMEVSYVTPEEIGITPERLPALLFNESITAYPSIIKDWENNGMIVTSTRNKFAGTWYVLPVAHAPFYDAKEGAVRGRVSVTYIAMASCKECMEVPALQDELEAIGITPYHEEVLDVTSERAKLLIRKYNITAVPTIIMDGQAAFHSQLFPGWYAVGTVEGDGMFILRKLDRMRVTYYDLKREQVMIP